jgi:hypothetical protein
MLAFLILTAVTFSLFGFIIGIWADGFEKLQLVPLHATSYGIFVELIVDRRFTVGEPPPFAPQALEAERPNAIALARAAKLLQTVS